MTPNTPRPVKAYAFDRNLRAIAYVFKGDFTRRVHIPSAIDDDGETTSRQNTRPRLLRAWQKVELAVLLHQIGLYDRLILRDIKFVRTPAGIRLRLRSSKGLNPVKASR